jgi:hypothetical protein
VRESYDDYFKHQCSGKCVVYLFFLKKKIGTDTPLKKKKKIAGLGSRV